MIAASPLTVTDVAAMLRAGIHGDVVTPDESSYAAATFGVAPGLEPEIVVIATDAADVAVTVRVAARSGRRVAVQAGGSRAAHSAGNAPDTILIVTRLLAGVRIDPVERTATVGAGSSWRQVVDAAEPFGLSPLSGNTPGTGATGRDRGGRLSPVGRSFGFAAERVRSYQVVTAGGDLVEVDAEHDSGLFQALRAGGAAIVTAMTIDLIPADQQYAGGLWFTQSDAAAVLERWTDWVSVLPQAASASIGRLDLPDAPEVPPALRGRSVVHLRFAHHGDPAEGARVLAPMRAAAVPLLDGVRVPSGGRQVVDAEPASACC